MSTNLPKDENQHRSSGDRTQHTTGTEKNQSAAIDGLSNEQLEEIFERAHRTVKPIIKREAENEIVSKEILDFKIG